jgi:hypothetical protein
MRWDNRDNHVLGLNSVTDVPAKKGLLQNKLRDRLMLPASTTASEFSKLQLPENAEECY